MRTRLVKYLVEKTVRPVMLQYLRKDRRYAYDGIELLVKQGVFHPGLFFSTKFLLDALRHEPLNGKSVLELGAGSGLIAFWCADRGAHVTATDINATAIQGLQHNNRLARLQLQHIIHSDLFAHIPQQPFDYLIINPPYYPRQPKNDAEQAWFCGENFEYFDNLFKNIGSYMQPSGQVWMSLSEDCDLASIREIATGYNLVLSLKKQRRIWWERQMIYSITPRI